jgi:hypothetical protein
VPEADALLAVSIDRAQQRVDVDARPIRDAPQHVAVLDQVDRVRPGEANCSMWPWVNPRSNWPRAEQAQTPANNRGMPPTGSRPGHRCTPRPRPSPHEVILPAGFAAVDLTRVELVDALLGISSDEPARSASAISRRNRL